jgi:hypothetical protein
VDDEGLRNSSTSCRQISKDLDSKPRCLSRGEESAKILLLPCCYHEGRSGRVSLISRARMVKLSERFFVPSTCRCLARLGKMS